MAFQAGDSVRFRPEVIDSEQTWFKTKLTSDLVLKILYSRETWAAEEVVFDEANIQSMYESEPWTQAYNVEFSDGQVVE